MTHNTERFERFVPPHLPALFAYVRSLCSNKRHFEEEWQCVLIHILEHIDAFRPEQGDFLPWAKRCAKLHLCTLQQRERLREQQHWGDGDEEGAAFKQYAQTQIATPHEDNARSFFDFETFASTKLWKALMQLQPADREALLWRAEGYKAEEIARIQDCSASSVNIRLRRARNSVALALTQRDAPRRRRRANEL